MTMKHMNVRAWARITNSSDLVALAETENAPDSAVYRDRDRWVLKEEMDLRLRILVTEMMPTPKFLETMKITGAELFSGSVREFCADHGWNDPGIIRWLALCRTVTEAGVMRELIVVEQQYQFDEKPDVTVYWVNLTNDEETTEWTTESLSVIAES